MKLLSIVFSFRNEEGNIQKLVERVHGSLKDSSNWKYELIFVNDDSTDKSENILLKLQKESQSKLSSGNLRMVIKFFIYIFNLKN